MSSSPSKTARSASANDNPAGSVVRAVMPTYARANVVFERGEGAWLISTTGERYLDFASGVAVNALGHAHPKLIAALTEQASKLWHSSNLYRVAGQEKLAERLCEVTFADQVFFCNSGAEACEGAIKLARRYHYVNGQPERWRHRHLQGRLPRPHARHHRRGRQRQAPGRLRPAGRRLRHCAVRRPRGRREGHRAGDGRHHGRAGAGRGRRQRRAGRLAKALRELCDRHGLLLVLDEVQTGMGRTGKLFAHEWAGITPDVMAVAKGLGGGFPIGAVLATKDAAKGMVAGTHGSTFGGNPLAAAVGNAVLEAVLEPGFLEHVQDMALRFKQQLAALKDAYPPRHRGGARQRPADGPQGQAADGRCRQRLHRPRSCSPSAPATTWCASCPRSTSRRTSSARPCGAFGRALARLPKPA